MTQANDAYTRGLLFHLSEIRSQGLEVLGTDRGELVGEISLPEATPYRQAFALSPDGERLALLSGSRLQVYPLRP